MICELDDTNSLYIMLSQIASKNRIVLACAGTYGKYLGEWLNKKNVDWYGYIDNDATKVGTELNGKKIFSAIELVNQGDMFIIICSIFCYNELYEQILNLGFNNDKIFGFSDRYIFDKMLYEMKQPQQYTKKLLELKNCVKSDERCFIIGNGPSLRLEDLDKIGKECSFATNDIVRCFKFVKWRPTGYFMQDAITQKRLEDEYFEVVVNECKYVFCSVKTDAYRLRDEKIHNLYFYYHLDRPYNQEPYFSDKIEDVVGCASTTVFTMLQVAAYMGYKKIYLLGMDLGFGIEKHANGEIKKRGNYNAQAEFLNQDGDYIGTYEVDKILLGYHVAKKYANEHDICIYNATRGGFLEVFDRVDFDSLFTDT